ncbi:MAG: glycosyltransferase, exosortase A system-associated [Pseudomonadales bacterium]|jgi:PEP-CTERM/exosortase A-associated glycosyltransferase|nr:glycosyltransferase, exosortase A system-associated [Pseudomonadales bacterium]MCP5331953.1 glycosyltransferase, exosortase A system-associated [Pseudomonadales bacterium]HMU89703.1 glycosyltransferase, exosortase A system-associated [Pseudomonadales bacterium]HMW14554.1 glycosyltransferase, exosortase A system-associated [Pseudomonadales bacterium]HMW84004.1 glycosyltransferase, exosortase A system-associated [Pseudomonadales bacterium]
MHILHILDHSIPLQSGYTFRTRNILRQQRALGWQTSHLTGPKQTGCTLEREEVDGLLFHRTPATAAGGGWLPEPLAVIAALGRRLDQVIEELRPDLLHAHSPALDGIAALRAGRRHRLPVVYECRAFWEDAAVDHGTSREWGVRYRLTRLMESWVFRRADAITTICAGLRDEIIGRGIAAGKITVIPNAVDLAQFGSADEPDAALQAQLGLTGQRVLGFVGSFYGYEGLDLAVAALAQIGDPAVKLLLVGGGPQEQALRAQVERLGLGQRVIFTGRVPHQEVNRYYSLIDLLLYPRHSMRLTDLVTPLKPLEAMAQQKLLLASDVGGHRELIEDGRTGWLFPAGDAAALARRAEQILAQPDEWPKIRAAGRAFVEQERNWPASVARYRDLYARLLTAA